MGSKGTVYLAGKMTGLDREEMNKWRHRAEVTLLDHGFKIANPASVPFNFDGYSNSPTNKEIIASNKFQIQRSDIILAELNHTEISHGTNAEIVYAGTIGKPVIVWGENYSVINSPWIAEHTVKQFSRMDDALEYIVTNWRL